MLITDLLSVFFVYYYQFTLKCFTEYLRLSMPYKALL